MKVRTEVSVVRTRRIVEVDDDDDEIMELFDEMEELFYIFHKRSRTHRLLVAERGPL